MPGIQSSLLRVLPETVAARGLDPMPLWQRMGLQPGADQPGQRVSLADWVATLDLAQSLTGDPAIGLWAAQAVRPLHLGPLGYALMSSGHGADGLAVFERFQAQLCDALAVRMALEPGLVALHHEALMGETLPRHAGFWCFLFGARLAFGRWVSGRELVLASLTLCAPQPDPALADAFARFAGCPVHWHASESVERFPFEWLNWLNPHADANLHALMHQRLEQTQPAADAGERLLQTVADAVRMVMARGDEVELATVLSHWQAMPGHDATLTLRQMQDRLADLGRPFKTLVDQVRRDEALRLLKDTKLPLADVALACGYAEPSPFHRAVKRWTGLTPAQVRDNAAR